VNNFYFKNAVDVVIGFLERMRGAVRLCAIYIYMYFLVARQKLRHFTLKNQELV